MGDWHVPPNGGGLGMDQHGGAYYPPLPTQQQDQPAVIQQQQQQQLAGRAPNRWAGNDINTLLVVATLITTLTYQVGTSIPGGYWQQDILRPQDSTVMYRAGNPIMRDLHHPRYWLFMAASWMGFVSSMVMTLSLLVQMAVDSPHVRWSFMVAYSSLVLTFAVSQPKTHLFVDILMSVAVGAFLWAIVSLTPQCRARIIQTLFCSGGAQQQN